MLAALFRVSEPSGRKAGCSVAGAHPACRSVLEIGQLVPEQLNLQTNLACPTFGIALRLLCAWAAQAVYGVLKARIAGNRPAGLSACVAASLHAGHTTWSGSRACCLRRCCSFRCQ